MGLGISLILLFQIKRGTSVHKLNSFYDSGCCQNLGMNSANRIMEKIKFLNQETTVQNIFLSNSNFLHYTFTVKPGGLSLHFPVTLAA